MYQYKSCFISLQEILFHFAREAFGENYLKGGLSDLGTKFFTKILKESSLYSKSILIFIHKTPVVENHPTTGETGELLRPRSIPTGITVYFYMSSSLIYILQIHRRKFQTLCLLKTLWKTITCLLCHGIKAFVTWFSHNALFDFWCKI